MLTHAQEPPKDPQRLVVLGTRGVIGRPLCQLCGAERVPLLPLSSAELDLLAADAAERLAGELRAGDSLVFLSALTPDKGRDIATLMKNLRMAEAVCGALARRPVAQIIYMSSDAVYPFGQAPVSEATPADPSDLYGVMHKAREVMVAGAAKDVPLAVLRCTMVIAAHDTHNSYGPNRFRRLARSEGRITLGGAGEETRDHIDADDVARLVLEVARHRSTGMLNLATGSSHSFDSVARKVAARFDPPAEVVHSERRAAVTHRHFDPTALHLAFPSFRFRPLEEALDRAHAGEAG